MLEGLPHSPQSGNEDPANMRNRIPKCLLVWCLWMCAAPSLFLSAFAETQTLAGRNDCDSSESLHSSCGFDESAADIQPATPRPKVLIIGDSISIGFMGPLQAMVQDRWILQHNPGNARYTRYGLDHIDQWLGSESWDVIHFNWGLWDLCYRHPDSGNQGHRDKINGILTTSLQDYESHLRSLVARLNSTGARLVWASTTPVPEGESGRFAGDEIAYNRVAAQVMHEFHIPINDLHSKIYTQFAELSRGPGDVHFSDHGNKILAGMVYEAIDQLILPPRIP